MGFDAAVIFVFMLIAHNLNEHPQRQISLTHTSRILRAESQSGSRQTSFKVGLLRRF